MKAKSSRRLTFALLLGLASAGVGYFLSIRAIPAPSASHLAPKRSVSAPVSFPLFPITAASREDPHLAYFSEKRATGLLPSTDPPPTSPDSSLPKLPGQETPDSTPISPDLASGRTIESIEKELAALKELKVLKERNRLINLADRTIITGKRSDFAVLEKYAQSSNDPALRESAELQIIRVDRHFHSRRGHRSSPINAVDFFPEKTTEDQLTIGNLLEILIDPSAPVPARIRAAELLGKTPPGSQPRLPGYLLYAAENAENLDLIDEALISFGNLTGVFPNRMFDCAPASVWWGIHNPEIPATTQSPPSQ